MTITIQNATGTAANANSYVTVAEFKVYCDARGMDYSNYGDPEIEQALIKSCVYLDERWRTKFKGQMLTSEQTTIWPRAYVYDERGTVVDGVPQKVKDCQCEYAFRALGSDLAPDPSVDDTGAKVLSRTEQVGSVSESVTYEAGVALSTIRPYPVADMMIGRYLKRGGVMRA